MPRLLLAVAALLIPLEVWAASGDLLWRREVRDVIGCPEPVVSNRILYTHSLATTVAGGEFFPLLQAWRPAPGEVVWEERGRSELEPASLFGPGVTAVGGRIFTAAFEPGSKLELPRAAALTARDADSGELLWTVELDETSHAYELTALAATEDRVFALGTRRSRSTPGPIQPFSEVALLALDSGTGRELWSRFVDLTGGFNEGRTLVVGRGLTVVSAAVARRGGKLSGALRAYDSASGRLVWHRETRTPEPFALQRHGDRVFVLGWAKNLRATFLSAYDLSSGATLWRKRIRDAILHSMAVAQRTVAVYGQDGFARTGDSRVRAYDRENGRLLWLRSEPEANAARVAAKRGGIYTVGDWTGAGGLWLAAYRGRTGELRWSLPRPADDEDDFGCFALVHDDLLLTTSGSQPAVLRAFVP